MRSDIRDIRLSNFVIRFAKSGVMNIGSTRDALVEQIIKGIFITRIFVKKVAFSSLFFIPGLVKLVTELVFTSSVKVCPVPITRIRVENRKG